MELTSEKSCCSAGNNQVDEQAGITHLTFSPFWPSALKKISLKADGDEEVTVEGLLTAAIAEKATPVPIPPAAKTATVESRAISFFLFPILFFKIFSLFFHI